MQRLRRLCLDYPERDDYRLALANGWLYRGILDDRLERPASTILAALTECLGAYDPLCQKGFPSAHLNRAIGRQCLAGVYDREGRTDEKVATGRRAYRDLQAATALFPAWGSRYEQIMAQLRADFAHELGAAGESD